MNEGWGGRGGREGDRGHGEGEVGEGWGGGPGLYPFFLHPEFHAVRVENINSLQHDSNEII